jgi:hypothetical protein
VFFCILCRGRKVVRIEAFSEKLKQQNLCTFNIEMIGVPMKRDYQRISLVLKNRIWGKKLMNTPVKDWISAEAAEYKLFYRSDNYSFMTFSRCRQSVSNFDLRI